MKKIKLFSISILSVLLLFTSCKKDDNGTDDNDPQNNKNFLSAKIDGVDFLTDFPIYLSITEKDVTISGQDEQNTMNIQISIFDYNGPGTYTIESGTETENIMTYIKGSVWQASDDIGSGTVTFIREGKFLKGTFSFNGVSLQDNTTKNITEGLFNVQIVF